MKSAKTALGKTINMAALAAKHETTRAVSNIPVNARGDIIDNRGNVKSLKKQLPKNSIKTFLLVLKKQLASKKTK